jgi:hypothetical protein
MATREEIKKFSELIIELGNRKRIDYFDAIILHCEETGLEVELAAQMLTPALKAKITEQAENANMIKRTNRLPL